MKLIIDDANIEKIKNIYSFYPVDGVTTNPTILSKVDRDPLSVLKEIREFIGDEQELHVQATAMNAEGMVEDAHKIIEVLGKNTYIKIPAIKEGFKAMKILKKEDIRITATAIYAPMQAFISAKCGADYVAPYINRIDNLGYNGIGVAKQIQNIFNSNCLDTKILAASFKNSQQILELCEYGIGAATIAPEVIDNLVNNQCVNHAVNDFIKDIESLIGKGKTMKDVL